MTSAITSDINEAITILRSGNCTHLNACNAGGGDTELFEIIKCIGAGFGSNLISIKLTGNNFSREGIRILYAIIGPTNVARAINSPRLNNDNPTNPQ